MYHVPWVWVDLPLFCPIVPLEPKPLVPTRLLKWDRLSQNVPSVPKRPNYPKPGCLVLMGADGRKVPLPAATP
jgi:hypothetical protein